MLQNETQLSTKPTTPLQILQQVFGYSEFRQGQADIIQTALNAQDCLVVMATGNGKSLCYQIPALVMEGVTLVVCPLISLMQDQVSQLQANGIHADFLNSTQTYEQQQVILNKISQQQLKLLYISPEKALHPTFLSFIRQQKINLIAIDEAHCISQWGHDFRREYSQLGQLKQLLPNIPIMALTATADHTTQSDIVQLLYLNQPVIYIGNFDRPNIRYHLVEKMQGMAQIGRFVQSQQGKSGIIYCNSRNKVEQITHFLLGKGIKVAGYHAGLETELRSQVQMNFQRDNLQVVVATVAFGMGINKPNIRFVAHFDLPRSIESYYQETGRAGRDGLPAEAVLFYNSKDYQWLYQCLLEKPNSTQRHIEEHKLQAMGAFAETQTCRRLVLLNYFGEYQHQPCNNCDICLNPPKYYDGLLDAQKVLSTVYRVNQKYGLYHVIAVLRGMNNQRLLDAQHDKLSVYGIGKEKSHEYWVSVIRQLIHLGYLQQDITAFSALQLTSNARIILRGEIPLQLAVPRLELSVLQTRPKTIHYNKTLFERLRFLRKKIADKENLPPYVIFNDATLQEMAQHIPKTEKELLQINGVGEVKLRRYASSFLALLQQY